MITSNRDVVKEDIFNNYVDNRNLMNDFFFFGRKFFHEKL